MHLKHIECGEEIGITEQAFSPIECRIGNVVASLLSGDFVLVAL